MWLITGAHPLLIPKNDPANESGTEKHNQSKTIESKVPAGRAPEAPEETRKRFKRLSKMRRALTTE